MVNNKTTEPFRPEERDRLLERVARLEQVEREYQRVAAALKESEERFRIFFEQAADALYVIDPEGRFVDVNQQACEDLGYSREELLGMSVSKVDQGFRSRPLEKWFWEKLPQDQAVSFEVEHTRRDGTRFLVEVRQTVIERAQLKTPLILALARNVTERKKAEAELARHRDHLQDLVRERTAQIEAANASLQKEVEQRIQAQEALQEALRVINNMKKQVEAENTRLKREIERRGDNEEIIGQSDVIQMAMRQVEQVAGTEATVLILGETGTGKEVLARRIHNLSARRGRTMVTVNCAALPANLIESELFGREKGAYTGALSRQIGRFESADGSTIFLDEISEMPIELQGKLLRVLQEGQFERLGSSTTIKTNIRVIAATNRDLAKAVHDGLFREDLYYRLNVFPITVPPLRDRKDDIPILVGQFINEFKLKMGKKIGGASPECMDALKQYNWPGNIRELRNVIERSMIMSEGPTVRIEVPPGESIPRPLSAKLCEIEKAHVLYVLEQTGWRIRGDAGAAEVLGLKPTTLEARLKKLGLRRPELKYNILEQIQNIG